MVNVDVVDGSSQASFGHTPKTSFRVPVPCVSTDCGSGHINLGGLTIGFESSVKSMTYLDTWYCAAITFVEFGLVAFGNLSNLMSNRLSVKDMGFQSQRVSLSQGSLSE
jgi:hypothetical protein